MPEVTVLAVISAPTAVHLEVIAVLISAVLAVHLAVPAVHLAVTFVSAAKRVILEGYSHKHRDRGKRMCSKLLYQYIITYVVYIKSWE